ncbi:MAG: protein-tyrosine sulfotransferase [Bacteroidia bacterium]|jgi:protein-tyrosine sulfotransferase
MKKYLFKVVALLSFAKLLLFYRLKNLNLFEQYFNQTDNNVSPFFIVGSGRSGNTLLRVILNNHNKISIPPESYFLQSVIRVYIDAVLSKKPWEAIVELCIEDIKTHKEFHTWNIDLNALSSELLGSPNQSLQGIIDGVFRSYIKKHDEEATIWGDKTPMNIFYVHWLIKLFPNAKFINIYRDGRDVVNSYVKSGLIPNLKDACFRWNVSVDCASQWEQKFPNNFFSIRYEDLVKNQVATISKVCEFLNLEFDDSIFDYLGKPSELGDVDLYKHHTNVKKPVNMDSIGKWKTQLNKKEQDQTNHWMKTNLKKLYYIDN